jgi:hypothetical protein
MQLQPKDKEIKWIPRSKEKQMNDIVEKLVSFNWFDPI